MLSDQEIQAAATARLITGKLTGSDVDDLVSAFRLVLGPLEETLELDLRGDLESLDDTSDTRKKAAKMAACVIRLQNEDFGVASLTGELENSDHEQRRLFTIYALGLLYVLPIELTYMEPIDKVRNITSKKTVSVPVTFVP